MTYIHDKCKGEIETFPSDDLPHCEYGLCTVCGDEGLLIVVEENIWDKTVLVAIPLPSCNRLESF